MMDAARAAGVPVAVCSASTQAAVDFVLPNLLGTERFASLDLYMAGDDVALKKPDPTIYRVRPCAGGWGGSGVRWRGAGLDGCLAGCLWLAGR